MPERQTRFVPAEWPDPEDDRPEFNDRARAVFTWRRYCKARRAWIQARGGPVLDEMLAEVRGARRIWGVGQVVRGARYPRQRHPGGPAKLDHERLVTLLPLNALYREGFNDPV